MSRRVVLFLVLAVVLVLGAGAALVISGRSALHDDRAAVDDRWDAVRPPLAARYQALDGLAAALDAAGVKDRSYTTDLANDLATWKELVAATDAHPGAEATTANRLEGLAARVRVNVFASARLSRDPGITQAFQAFDAALVPPPDVRRYNAAVRRYQDTRRAPLKRLAAEILGYGPRPVLVLGGQ